MYHKPAPDNIQAPRDGESNLQVIDNKLADAIFPALGEEVIVNCIDDSLRWIVGDGIHHDLHESMWVVRGHQLNAWHSVEELASIVERDDTWGFLCTCLVDAVCRNRDGWR